MNNILRLRYLLLVCTILFLVGCMPYINAYYLPNTTEGYLQGHSKRTSDEPLWILERDGAMFNFSASRENSDKVIFRLNIQPLHLPKERSLSAKKREQARATVKPITVVLTKLQDGVMVTSNGQKRIPNTIRITQGQYGTNRRFALEVPTHEIYLPVDHYLALDAMYKLKCHICIVTWPPILINGKLVQIPPIEFEWKRGIQVQFING